MPQSRKRKLEILADVKSAAVKERKKVRPQPMRTRSSSRKDCEKSENTRTSLQTESSGILECGKKRKRKLTQAQIRRLEMTEEERKEDRAKRNRASALKSRNKRRTRLAFLEIEYKKLQERIRQLERQNEGLQKQNELFSQQGCTTSVIDSIKNDELQSKSQNKNDTAPMNRHIVDLNPLMTQESLSMPDFRQFSILPRSPVLDLLDFDKTIDYATGSLTHNWSALEDEVRLDLNIGHYDDRKHTKSQVSVEETRSKFDTNAFESMLMAI